MRRAISWRGSLFKVATPPTLPSKYCFIAKVCRRSQETIALGACPTPNLLLARSGRDCPGRDLRRRPRTTFLNAVGRATKPVPLISAAFVGLHFYVLPKCKADKFPQSAQKASSG